MLPRSHLLTWANLITATRLLAALPTAWCAYREFWWATAVLFLTAIASDFADGVVARRLDQSSTIGGTFDHATDATFVSITLGACAALGLVPILLPPLVMAAFLQYLVDSRALAGQPLRGSRLGRWNGIAYYFVAGLAMLAAWWQVEMLAVAMWWGAWLLVLTTLVSMGERAWLLTRSLNR